MAKFDPSRERYHHAVHQHILSVIKSGVSRREMASILGVTRQAIASYVTERTTPKPHIIEKLLTKWPTKLPFRNTAFGAGAYAVPTPKIEEVPLQGDLFAALNAVKPENLKIEVTRDGTSDLELRVSIKIAG